MHCLREANAGAQKIQNLSRRPDDTHTRTRAAPLPCALEQMTVEIALINEAELPKYQTAGAVGFDLAANEACFVDPHQTTLIPTGIIVKPEPGYFVMVVGRSSLAKRGLMLANSVGIVDPDYCGPTDQIWLPIHNLSSVSIEFRKGDRLAQGIVMPIHRAAFVSFAPAEKDRGGLGSTGL